MASRFADPLITAITHQLPAGHGLPLCTSGNAAARATLQLMADDAKTLPPQHILDSFENDLADGRAVVATQEGLCADLHQQTTGVLLLGARTLAMIWEAAWATGGGNAQLLQHPPDRNDIQRRYIDNDFLP